MKKIVILTITFSFLFFNFSSAQEENAGSRITFSVKGWNNGWTHKFTDSKQELEGDSNVTMVGPALAFRNGKFFGAISYLLATSDYSFKKSTVTFSNSAGTITEELDFKFGRSDLDLIGGLMLHPRFGIFGGYKRVAGDETVKTSIVADSFTSLLNDSTTSVTDKGDYTLAGPGIGAMVNLPITGSLVLYGSFGYMFLAYEESFDDGSKFDEDQDGFSVEVGGAYMVNEYFSASLGYKFQSFTGDTSKDEFSGITFGVNYTM